jgi:hypothetical protein
MPVKKADKIEEILNKARVPGKNLSETPGKVSEQLLFLTGSKIAGIKLA